MAKPNTSGLPDTGDYALGRGVIYMAEIDTSTGLPNSDGWLDLGNAPQINLSIEEETLEHRSSRSGTATVDKSVTISKKATISFQLDEINQKTVELFFSGLSDTFVNPAVAGEAEQVAKYPNVKLGRWYDLTTDDGIRIMGVDVGDLVIEKDAGMDVPLVEGTDFTWDATWGRFRLHEDAVNVAEGDEVNVTVTADAMAPSPINRTKALMSTNRLVALKVIGVNPANNDEETEWEIHQVQLKADGELALIGEEFMVAGFTGVLEANTQGYPTSPYMTIHTHSES